MIIDEYFSMVTYPVGDFPARFSWPLKESQWQVEQNHEVQQISQIELVIKIIGPVKGKILQQMNYLIWVLSFQMH